MNDTESKKKNEDPGLRNTLKNDISNGDFYKTFMKDIKGLRAYYISEEKNKQLSQMNWLKRIFMFSWWLLKSLILKLTPFRRIILLVSIFFLVIKFNINSGDSASADTYVIGVLLLLFILMLELKDKLLAHDELEAGRKIQNALMPDVFPEFSGWSLMLYTRSANEVSGDLVDYIKIEDDRAGILISDVAGKGLKAALLTTKLQATVRAFVSELGTKDLISKVNNIFYRDSIRSIFASMLYIEIKENSGLLKFVNAGHLPPVIVSEDGINEIPKGDAALGLMKNAIYNEYEYELKKGEFLFAYSDGLTEARNDSGQFYGNEKLNFLLKIVRNKNAKDIGEAIIADLDKFAGEFSNNDDLSLIILKRI